MRGGSEIVGDVRLLIISLLSRGVGVLWSGAKNRG